MKSQPVKARSLGNFSFARGVGMILVIMGHSCSFMATQNYQHGFTLFENAISVIGEGFMIMFFMISGFSFYKRKFKKCLRTQAKLFLGPYYIVFALIIISKCLNVIIRHRPFPNVLLPTYLFGLNALGGKVIGGYQISDIGIFWFIWALFGGWIIYNQISQIRNGKIKNILVLLCVISGWLLTCFSKIYPFCIHAMLLAVGGLAAGVYIQKNKLLERPWTISMRAGVICFSMISLAFGNMKIMQGIWKLGILDICGVFSVGLVLMKFFYWIERKQENSNLCVVCWIEMIGFYSLWIICIHAYESQVFPWWVLSYYFSPMMSSILCFICRCCAIFIIFFLVKKVRYYFMKYKCRKNKIVLDSE